MPLLSFLLSYNSGRSRRSASPSKIASPRKTAGSTRARRAKAGSVEPPTTTNGTKLEPSLETPVEESTEAESGTSEPKQGAVVRVNVDTDVVVEGDVETTHTHVEVEMPANLPELPLPEDTEAMIAKAKEMVEAAVRGQAEADASSSKQLKRGIDQVEAESDLEETAMAVSKKARTEVVELKKERVKTRTLLGISATLVIG